MSCSATVSLLKHFAVLEDVRVNRTRRHPLVNIVAIAICAVICGAEHFTEIEEFGNEKKDWLARFLDLSNGIPSHDTFNAVLSRLNPEEFEKCLLNWILSLQEATKNDIIAIDGKTLRGSYDRQSNKSAIHMVSAWATANHLSLASTVVEEKSNEITAIPRLLKLIDISGALVTTDAMGCQREIAEQIVKQGGDFVLAVKDNQPKLHEAVESLLMSGLENDFQDIPHRRFEDKQRGHGRIEERNYYLMPIPNEFSAKKKWPHVKAIGVAINFVERDGKDTYDVRYYILSKYISGRRFAKAVRSHWSVENNLHWQLDVSFREDDLRIRKGHAPANMSILMRSALSLLKSETTKRCGIKSKRKAAGWSTSYLEKILGMATI